MGSARKRGFCFVFILTLALGGGEKQVGWVPCPLFPPRPPPTKSPVSSDAKTFEAGWGDHCVAGAERKGEAAPSLLGVGTWFSTGDFQKSGEGGWGRLEG